MKSHVAFSVLFSVVSLVVFGQEQNVNRISTDRPLQSETPIVVPKKYLQFELGAQYAKTSLSEKPGTSSPNYDTDHLTEFRYSVPTLMIKYGLSNRLELQAGFTYRYNVVDYHTGYRDYFEPYYHKNDNRSYASGSESPFIGAKYQFMKAKANGKGSNLSLSSRFAIPVYSDFSSDELRLSSRLTWNKTLVGSWYVTSGLGFSYGNNLNSDGILLVQTGVQVWHFMTIAGEDYHTVYFDRFNNQTSNHPNLNGALIFALGQNHQLDVSAGTSAIGQQKYLFESLPANYNDFYIGIGYSCRLGL